MIAGRYRLERELAPGGVATVWLAHDVDLDLDVVVKIRTVVDDDELRRLRHEAATLMQVIAHPGLPVVRNDVLDGDRYCLVSDYVSGTDLHSLVTSGEDHEPSLGLPAALDVIDQIAAALDHLHGHRPAIVHGDVKPENVVLTEDGHVVLVDFGTAIRAGEIGDRVGSPGYAAPELMAGEAVGPAADIYSLAATAVFVLTGLVPRVGSDWSDSLTGRGLERLERVLRRALTWDPVGRPRSASEFAARLRDAAEMELPTGTVTIVLAEATMRGRPSPVLDVLERHGGRIAPTVSAPEATAAVVFGRATDAIAGAVAASAPDRGPVTVHAGDLGGWHGATLQQLVNEAAVLRRHAAVGSVVCSPPVRMLVGAASGWAFEPVANGLRVRVAGESDGSPLSRATDRADRWVRTRAARPIAGREDEIARLLSAIERGVERGVVPIALVSADAGVGKTRVLAEVAARRQALGDRVVVGRSTEAGGAFEAFLDALGDDALPFDQSQVERDEEGWIDRRRFFGAVAERMRSIGGRVLLVLDDAHWIDGSSLALLRQLIEDLGDTLAVVAGARPTPIAPELQRLIADTATTPVRLRPLDRDGMAELAAAEGVGVDDALVDDLLALTGGSPFFGLQLLEHLQTSPGGRLDAGSVPSGARDWVLGRVDRLGDDVRAVLAPAAIVGDRFDVVTLADVLGASPLEVIGPLDRAVGDGLLLDGEHAGEYAFVHSLIATALGESITPSRRALLHAAAAECVERRADDLAGAEAALHHWFAADRLGDPLHTAELAAAVAERATGRLAHERAVAVVDRALDVLAGAPAGDERARAEARLRLARGRADLVASDLDSAITQSFRAADLAEAAGDGWTLAHAALIASMNRRHGRDEPELLALIERATHLCPDDPPILPAMLHVRRARLLPTSVPQEDRAAMARRGLEYVDRMDDVDRATVEIEVARAGWGPDDAAERERLMSRLIASGEQILRRSDRPGAGRHRPDDDGVVRWTGVLIEALGHRSSARVQLGELRAARADADRAAELADRAGSTFLLTRSMMNQAMILATLGEHEAAERLAADAVAMSDRHNLVLVQMAITYAIARDRGQQAQIAALEVELERVVDRNPLFTAGFGLAHAEAGQHDDARRVLSALHDMAPWPRNWLWLAATTAALETAVIVGDVDATRRYAAVLARYSGQWALGGAELACWGPVDRVLGVAHLAQGRTELGRSELASALAQATVQGAAPWIARCEAALAST